MATTNAHKERDDRHSRALKSDDPDLKRRNEMARVMYKLLDDNWNAGNIDDKEMDDLDHKVTKATDLASFFAVLTEIDKMFRAKEQAQKLKGPTVVKQQYDSTVEIIKTIDARYLSGPAPQLLETVPRSVQELINMFSKPAPPDLRSPTGKDASGTTKDGGKKTEGEEADESESESDDVSEIPVEFEEIRKKFKKENNAEFCEECGEVTSVYGTKLCSGCRRKRERQEKSPLKKKLNALNRELARQERQIAERANMIELARKRDNEIREKKQKLDQLNALMPK